MSRYLQDVAAVRRRLVAQPPVLEEAAELDAGQQQALLQVLGLLQQQRPLPPPQLGLQAGLEPHALQLEVPPRQGLLVVLPELGGGRRQRGGGTQTLGHGGVSHPKRITE